MAVFFTLNLSQKGVRVETWIVFNGREGGALATTRQKIRQIQQHLTSHHVHWLKTFGPLYKHWYPDCKN